MINSTDVITSILPDLHAAAMADLVFWDQDKLINWADECIKQLGRLAPVFTIRDTSVNTSGSVPSYSLPPRHVATIHVSLGAVSLRPSNISELEALDPDFQSVLGAPERWYEDALDGSGALIGLAPIPTVAAPLPIVYASFPPQLDVGQVNTMVPAPPPVKGYMANYILAEALQQESEAEMPDVAAHCKGRLALYEQAFQQYFGKL
jgi:hypothetical protein